MDEIKIMHVQLRKPFFPQKSIIKIKNDITKVLKIGRLTLGENLSSFEQKFAKYVGVKHAVGVSSGTAALHLSLKSLDIGINDQVIVPAKTFISTAHAVTYCQAKPVFCDVEEDTFQMNPSKLNKLITKKTKAIIPVHLGGNVCNMNEILEISKKYNIPIVEDAAHAHGSTLDNQKAGSFGLLSAFSFYPDKVMASSDGGMVVTDNKKLQDKIMLLRNVGRKNIGEYDFSIIGYNYRMNEIQAIIAKEQLTLLPRMLQIRRKIASIYNSEFSGLKSLKIQKIHSNIKSSYYAYIMKLSTGNLTKLRNRLQKNGIETSPMFVTIYKTKPYRFLGMKKKLCPISEKLDKQTFTVPLHPGMTNTQIDRVIKEIKKTHT